MKDEKTMRTWAEIDLDALAGNCKALRAMMPARRCAAFRSRISITASLP